MTTPFVLVLSILTFFRRVWASVAVILKFQEKPTDLVQDIDIEAGIPIPEAAKGANSGVVLDIAHEDVDLKPVEELPPQCERPSRRPSRRTSAVDPLKSRIVDATLKQVQDKTINFVKTVTLTPSTIVANECTAKIEYYEPRSRSHDIKKKAKGEARVVQFALPPTIVEDISASSVSTTSEDEENYRPTRRRSENSITDLLDLFPLPPTYIPTAPHSTSAARRLTQRPLKAGHGYPDDKARVEYADSSETDSMTSAYSSGSDSSDATADTSAPGTPNDFSSNRFTNEVICSSTPALSSSTNPYSSDSQPLMPEKPVLVADDSPSLTLPVKTTRISKIFSMPAMFSTYVSTNVTVLSAQSIEEPQQPISTGSKPRGLIERFHSVVDGFSKVDLQKGDICDELSRDTSNMAPVGRAGIQDILKTSPSEDAIVDDLLAGLENSLEIDQQRMESIPCSGTVDGLLAIISSEVVAKPDVCISQSVAPLRIVKKNQFPLVAQEEGEEPCSTEVSWEHSLEKVLKAFKEAEAEDSDFHDMFYSDSSFVSRSSLIRTSMLFGHPSRSSVPGSQGERLRCLHESFESVERSVEEVVEELELLLDTATINTEYGPVADSVDVSQENSEDTVNTGHETAYNSLADDNQYELKEGRCSSMAPSQERGEEEAKSCDTEVSSSWRGDLPGLDAYAE